VLSSPLVDPYLVAQYKRQIGEAKRFGLIKNGFDFDSWTELRFLNQALKDLSLQDYWESFDATGKSTRVAPTASSAQPQPTSAELAQLPSLPGTAP